jgi:hypothetical protein
MFKDLIANSNDSAKFIKLLLMFILIIIINTLLIRYLWNNSLVKHISILTPLKGFKDALLLAIALTIIRD